MAKLKNYKGMVIAVGGPPHSGKSVFLAELYRQLLVRRPAGVFLQRACPDGEGMWSDESDPAIVKEIRRKGKFSDEFVTFTLRALEALGQRFHIVLADLGGIRSAQNAEILARSTHLVLLCGLHKQAEKEPWVQFAATEGCELLGSFNSELVRLAGFEDYDPDHLDLSARSEMSADTAAAVATAHFRNLDRGKPGDTEEQKALRRECYREAVSQFSDWLIARAGKESAR